MPKDATTSQPKTEVEIKLRLASVAEGRRRLRKAGFRVAKRRVLEQNVIFDVQKHTLRRRGLVLRLRTSGAHSLVTFKGPAEPGKHKIRKEIEFELQRGGGAGFTQVLEGLGYRPAFRYEKYRTEYVLPTGAGRAMLDETPVGVFLELEGPPGWIDRTARRLGFGEADYITATYAGLHRSAGGGSRDMLF